MKKPKRKGRAFWIHARRERLLKDIFKAVPENPCSPRDWRDFTEEAKKLMPELFNEIQKYNRQNERMREKLRKVNFHLRKMLTVKIRYGSEADCESVVAEYLNKDLDLRD